MPNAAHPGCYPGALSRWDNETYVCSPCGEHEAMLQWRSESREVADKAVHPIHGVVFWKTPPKE
jgi:hypothetical protein